MMRAYLSSRFHRDLVIPEGQKVIVDFFIIGVIDKDGAEKQILFKGHTCVKVHVSGEPIIPLADLDWGRMMLNARNRDKNSPGNSSGNKRPRKL